MLFCLCIMYQLNIGYYRYTVAMFRGVCVRFSYIHCRHASQRDNVSWPEQLTKKLLPREKTQAVPYFRQNWRAWPNIEPFKTSPIPNHDVDIIPCSLWTVQQFWVNPEAIIEKKKSLKEAIAPKKSVLYGSTLSSRYYCHNSTNVSDLTLHSSKGWTSSRYNRFYVIYGRLRNLILIDFQILHPLC